MRHDASDIARPAAALGHRSVSIAGLNSAKLCLLRHSGIALIGSEHFYDGNQLGDFVLYSFYTIFRRWVYVLSLRYAFAIVFWSRSLDFRFWRLLGCDSYTMLRRASYRPST